MKIYVYILHIIYIYILHIKDTSHAQPPIWRLYDNPPGPPGPGARAIFFAFNVALAAIFGWASCPSWEVDDPKNYSITADILHIYIYLYIYIHVYVYNWGTTHLLAGMHPEVERALITVK